MKAVARKIHVFYGLACIQRGQLHFKLLDMVCLDAGVAASLEICQQAFVLEALDHEVSVACCAIRNNYDFGRLICGKLSSRTDGLDGLQAAAKNTIWTTGCGSWYLDDRGIPATWPFAFQRFREEMAAPKLEAFELRQ
jgi:hypothetical protein